MIREVKGDLIDMVKRGKFSVFAHGCNCFNVMGAGIAKGIKDSFPEMYEADTQIHKGDTWVGDISLLGQYSNATLNIPGCSINVQGVNLYTQYKPGAHFEYTAFRQSLELLKDSLIFEEVIGLPKIGCGIGGGDWDIVKGIIDEVFLYSKHEVVLADYRG